jgi:hypothetical protein
VLFVLSAKCGSLACDFRFSNAHLSTPIFHWAEHLDEK